MPEKWVDWSKSVRSKDYRGSSSFSTFMIIGRDRLLLPRDPIRRVPPTTSPLLWTSDPIEASYLDQLETHLKFVHQSPPLISRMLTIMIGTGFLGFFTKLFKASESNMLFDGASLVLYVIGVGVYIANIVKGLRFVSAGIWHADDFAGNVPPSAQSAAAAAAQASDGRIILGREDSLKVMAASNTILALVLLGVLVLQAGQWYAERKDNEDYERAAREAAEQEKNASSSASSPPTAAEKRASKKKQ
ncbi:hypothetical protein CIB48_g3449 [Xylaria polymorpha]|nr:hypothetical protein CIB48_g3449 [Xylaria polymorpha]